MAQMVQERAARKATTQTPVRSPLTPRPSSSLFARTVVVAAVASPAVSLNVVRDQEVARLRAEKVAEAKRTAEVVEVKAREERVREEERQALLRRVLKMAPAERKQYLEEQRLYEHGKALVAKLKKMQQVDEMDVEVVFGVRLEDV